VLEQVAQEYEDKLRIVGMGTQDSLDQAEDFLERNQVLLSYMTWDESFETWSYYDVRSQPTIILVEPDGAILGRWNRLNREMLDLVDEYTSA